MFESSQQISTLYPGYSIQELGSGSYSTFFGYMRYDGRNYEYRFEYALEMLAKFPGFKKEGNIYLFEFTDGYVKEFLSFIYNERYNKDNFHEDLITCLTKILKENNIIVIFNHRYKVHFDQTIYKDIFSYYNF
jgi:hypothetical protein